MSWVDRDIKLLSVFPPKEEKEPLKSDECPICKYKFADCQCRFCGKAHPNRWKRAKVVTDHLYLFSDAQIEHLKKVQEWWHTSYDDEEMENILKELEAERKEE